MARNTSGAAAARGSLTKVRNVTPRPKAQVDQGAFNRNITALRAGEAMNRLRSEKPTAPTGTNPMQKSMSALTTGMREAAGRPAEANAQFGATVKAASGWQH